MPELPDLELFATNLRPLCGQRVAQLTYHKTKRLNVPPDELARTLTGRTLAAVHRVGKEIHFTFSPSAVLGVHLMLKGEFHHTATPSGVRSPVLTLTFTESATALVVADPMALTVTTLNPAPSTVLDALAVTPESLKSLLRAQPYAPIKTVLMDQAVLAGIGNAYADEILYEARIAPRSLSGRLPEQAVHELAHAIPRVLNAALEQLRAATPDALRGEYRDFLRIHHPERTHAPSGAPLRTEELNKRKTYFTDDQLLYT